MVESAGSRRRPPSADRKRVCPRCELPLARSRAGHGRSRAPGPPVEICGLCCSLEAVAELTGSAIAPTSRWPLPPPALGREYANLAELARTSPTAVPPPALRRATHRLPGIPDRVEIQALNCAGDRWVLLAVKVLARGPMRDIALRRELARLCTSSAGRPPSAGALSARLAQMVADGLCSRTRYREVPPRVEYALTHAGAALIPIVEAIETWGDRWQPGR